eukprot:906672-Alexandrium_andersonii.AAC.1
MWASLNKDQARRPSITQRLPSSTAFTSGWLPWLLPACSHSWSKPIMRATQLEFCPNWPTGEALH